MAEKAKKPKKVVEPIFVDIDNAIEKYNEEHPEQEVKLTRKLLAKELDLDYQTIVNYQGGRVPRSFGDLKKIIDKTGAKFNEIVKSKK